MRPEQQRIAIAEARGWVRMDSVEWMGRMTGRFFPEQEKRFCHASDCPNYLEDLNAMHEAEKSLMRDEDNPDDSGLMGNYQEALALVTGANKLPLCEIANDVAYFQMMISATAAQRAEAFLRTLNLWKD